MNKARRARQKANRASSGGGHTVADHRTEPDPDRPGKTRTVRCPVCRPVAKTWDRSLSGKAVDTRA